MINYYYLEIVEPRLQLSRSGATFKKYFSVNNPRINRKQGLDIALLFSKLFFSSYMDVPLINRPAVSRTWVYQLIAQGILVGKYSSLTMAINNAIDLITLSCN